MGTASSKFNSHDKWNIDSSAKGVLASRRRRFLLSLTSRAELRPSLLMGYTILFDLKVLTGSYISIAARPDYPLAEIESIEGSRARIFPTLHPITVEAVKCSERETADSRNEIYLVEW